MGKWYKNYWFLYYVLPALGVLLIDYQAHKFSNPMESFEYFIFKFLLSTLMLQYFFIIRKRRIKFTKSLMYGLYFFLLVGLYYRFYEIFEGLKLFTRTPEVNLFGGGVIIQFLFFLVVHGLTFLIPLWIIKWVKKN